LKDLPSYIDEVFRDRPAQKRVVEALVNYGLSVRSGRIYLGDIKIPFSSLAEALGVDRRVVQSAVEYIGRDEWLSNFFERLLPAGPFLRDVARLLGYSVLSITPRRDQPGIIAGVSGVLARHGVNIVQVIAESPYLKEAQKLYIITEGSVPGSAIEEISGLEFIESIEIS